MEYLIERLFYIKRKTVHGIKYHFLKVKERDDYFCLFSRRKQFSHCKNRKITDKGAVRSDTAKHLQVNVWRR